MKQQLETQLNLYESPRSFEPDNRSKKIFREGIALGLISLIGGHMMDVPDLSFIGYATILTSAIGMTFNALKTRNNDIITYE